MDGKVLEDRCLALLVSVFLAPTDEPGTGAHLSQDNTNAQDAYIKIREGFIEKCKSKHQ